MGSSDPGTVTDRTLQAFVARQIRREILEGSLAPGARVKHVEVARRLGVSTTPVREALRELRTEGLLDGDPHHGMSVYRPSMEDLDDIYRIRLLLEPEGARRAAIYIHERELEEGRKLLGKMDGVTDAAEWTALNRLFHNMINASARRPRLSGILDALRAISELYVMTSLVQEPDRLKDSSREHYELLEACSERDGERAAAIMAAHLASTLEIARLAFDQADVAS